MNPDIFTIRNMLQKKLDPMRYEHSLSVSYTCMTLAMRYGCDLDQAELAGLIHDCAKCFDNDTLLQKCQKHEVELTQEEMETPNILHAVYGVRLAERKYGISDPEILGAIRWHTTGKPAMTMLEKIVYLADYIEPRRSKAEHLADIRKLAYLDLDEAVLKTMEDTVSYLKSRNYQILSVQEQALSYYRDCVRQNNHGKEK